MFKRKTIKPGKYQGKIVTIDGIQFKLNSYVQHNHTVGYVLTALDEER